MQFLAAILKSLVAGNFKTTVQFTQKQMVCVVILAVALLFAFVSLSIVIFIALLHFMSPLKIALIFSAFWLIVALGAFITFKIITTRKRQAHQAQMEEQKVNLMVASALAFLPALQKNKLWVAALPILGVAALYFLGSNDKKSDDNS